MGHFNHEWNNKNTGQLFAVECWHNPELAMITLDTGKATCLGQLEAMSYQKPPYISKEPQQIILQYRPDGPTEISCLD